MTRLSARKQVAPRALRSARRAVVTQDRTAVRATGDGTLFTSHGLRNRIVCTTREQFSLLSHVTDKVAPVVLNRQPATVLCLHTTSRPSNYFMETS